MSKQEKQTENNDFNSKFMNEFIKSKVKPDNDEKIKYCKISYPNNIGDLVNESDDDDENTIK